MILKDIKKHWLELADEFEQRLLGNLTDEQRAVYLNLLENIIPAEIDFIDEERDDELKKKKT